MRRGVVHDTTIVDYEPVHIMKAPPQSIMFPRSEKVDLQGVLHHIQENPDYFSDGIRKVPANVNVGNELSFSQPIYRNPQIKGTNNAQIAREPYWNPPGGVRYNMDFMQIPEEYGDLLRLRRPDTTIEPVQQATIGQHIARPEMVPTKVNALAITAMPSMVYENAQNFDPNIPANTTKPSQSLTVMPSVVYDISGQVPELGDPSRMLVIKPASSMIGVSADLPAQASDGAPRQLTKYVHDKELVNYLTPVFTTTVQIGDAFIPIHLKDPLEIVMLAQNRLPIDIPVPGSQSNIQLKDYTWTIVQPNLTAPAIFNIDITASLRDKPEMSHMVEPLLESVYKSAEQKEILPLDYNRDPVAVETPIHNPYEQMNFDGPQWTHRVSKPYSSYDGASVVIPEASQLLEFNVSMDRKPKIVPEPKQNTLIFTPWVNYA